MMKNYSFAVFAFVFLLTPYLNAQNFLLPLLVDSSHYQQFDQAGVPSYDYATRFEYNADELQTNSYTASLFQGDYTYYWTTYDYYPSKLLKEFNVYKNQQSWDGPWNKFSREEDQYDGQGRITYFLGQLPSNDLWVNFYQGNTGYDDGIPSDSLYYQLWNAATASWEYNYRARNVYYPGHPELLKHYDYDNWKSNFNQWVNYSDDEYTYFSDGKVQVHNNKLHLPEENEKVDSFIYRVDGRVDTLFWSNSIPSELIYNEFYIKYLYNNDGILHTAYQYKRNGQTNSWSPSVRTEYLPGDGIYSDDFALEENAEFNQVTQNYDPVNRTEREIVELGNDRILYVQRSYFRNAQGQLFLSSQDSSWLHLSTVGTHAPGAPTRVICRFSNPFTPGACIVCQTAGNEGQLQLQISDLNGRPVASTLLLPGESWRPNVLQAPAGVYVLRAWQNGQYLGQKRMLMLR